MNKRIINFRGFLIIGVILIAHILLSYYVFGAFKYDRVNAFTFVAIVFLSLLTVGNIFLIIFLWIKFGFSDKVLTFIVSFVCCLISFGFIFDTFISWPSENNLIDNYCGKIISSSYEEEYRSYVLTLNDVFTQDKRLEHNVVLYVEPNDEDNTAKNQSKYEIGKVVLFYAALKTQPLDGDHYNSDIAFTAFVQDDDVTLLGVGETSLIDKFQIKLHSVLIETLGNEIGELSYSMITGDKNKLSSEILDSFSASGLGHILAVSGLHIGFLSAALFWILKKCKLNKFANFAITGFAILFYCALAGFSGSVVRAGIMTMIALLAANLGRHNDTLNTLFCSVTCILTFRPLLILYVGFLMSISAVFGMIAFAPILSKMFSKIKFPKFLSKALSVSIAATVSIMPLTIIFFHFVSPYSILTNLIALPFIGISFVAVLVTTLLTMMLPFMSIFLKISSLGLALLEALADFVSKIPGARLTLFGGMFLLVVYLFYFIASRFIMKGKVKYPIVFICVLLSLAVIIKPNIYNERRSELIFFNNGYNVQSIVISDDKEVFFIGDFGGFYSISAVMKTAKIKKFDGIYLTSFSENSAYQLKKYFSKFPSVPVFIPIDAEVKGLKILLESNIEFNAIEKEQSFDNGIEAIYTDEVFTCYRYNSGHGAFVFFPKFVSKLPKQAVAEVIAVRAYFEPDVSYDGRYDDILFLVNEESKEGGVPYRYIADDEILSLNLDTKEAKRIKTQLW